MDEVCSYDKYAKLKEVFDLFYSEEFKDKKDIEGNISYLKNAIDYDEMVDEDEADVLASEENFINFLETYIYDIGSDFYSEYKNKN